ncbi:MAG: Smr/MutS family protein [Rhodoblastus sp.]
MTDHSRKGRNLSIEELELWRAVTATVRPRDPRKIVVVKSVHPKSDRRVDTHFASESVTKPKPAVRPLGIIDRRQQRELTKGRLEIDARIDLHGRRLSEAYQAVHDFLRRAHVNGAHMVLIVTGKGGNRSRIFDASADRDIGVLRRQAPLWLADPRLRHIVAAFGEAAQSHGGAGALYVRLRRK